MISISIQIIRKLHALMHIFPGMTSSSKSNWSTIIIAEHGTTSYCALMARDGTVLISVGSPSLLKEAWILLMTSYIKTYFIDSSNSSALFSEKMQSAILLAMSRVI